MEKQKQKETIRKKPDYALQFQRDAFLTYLKVTKKYPEDVIQALEDEITVTSFEELDKHLKMHESKKVIDDIREGFKNMFSLLGLPIYFVGKVCEKKEIVSTWNKLKEEIQSPDGQEAINEIRLSINKLIDILIQFKLPQTVYEELKKKNINEILPAIKNIVKSVSPKISADVIKDKIKKILQEKNIENPDEKTEEIYSEYIKFLRKPKKNQDPWSSSAFEINYEFIREFASKEFKGIDKKTKFKNYLDFVKTDTWSEDVLSNLLSYSFGEGLTEFFFNNYEKYINKLWFKKAFLKCISNEPYNLILLQNIEKYQKKGFFNDKEFFYKIFKNLFNSSDLRKHFMQNIENFIKKDWFDNEIIKEFFKNDRDIEVLKNADKYLSEESMIYALKGHFYGNNSIIENVDQYKEMNWFENVEIRKKIFEYAIAENRRSNSHFLCQNIQKLQKELWFAEQNFGYYLLQFADSYDLNRIEFFKILLENDNFFQIDEIKNLIEKNIRKDDVIELLLNTLLNRTSNENLEELFIELIKNREISNYLTMNFEKFADKLTKPIVMQIMDWSVARNVIFHLSTYKNLSWFDSEVLIQALSSDDEGQQKMFVNSIIEWIDFPDIQKVINKLITIGDDRLLEKLLFALKSVSANLDWIEECKKKINLLLYSRYTSNSEEILKYRKQDKEFFNFAINRFIKESPNIVISCIDAIHQEVSDAQNQEEAESILTEEENIIKTVIDNENFQSNFLFSISNNFHEILSNEVYTRNNYQLSKEIFTHISKNVNSCSVIIDSIDQYLNNEFFKKCVNKNLLKQILNIVIENNPSLVWRQYEKLTLTKKQAGNLASKLIENGSLSDLNTLLNAYIKKEIHLSRIQLTQLIENYINKNGEFGFVTNSEDLDLVNLHNNVKKHFDKYIQSIVSKRLEDKEKFINIFLILAKNAYPGLNYYNEVKEVIKALDQETDKKPDLKTKAEEALTEMYMNSKSLDQIYSYIESLDIAFKEKQLLLARVVHQLIVNEQLPILDKFTSIKIKNLQGQEIKLSEYLVYFIKKYETGNKGQTILVMSAAREYTKDMSLNELWRDIGNRLLNYERIIESYHPDAIPNEIRASIGMEYEVTRSLIDQYESMFKREYTSDIGRMSSYANIGTGKDRPWEVATKPVDNPYLLLLEMELLQGMDFLDFNFGERKISTSETGGFNKGSRGMHLTIGGVEDINATFNTNFLQNVLLLSQWGGVTSGEAVDRISTGRAQNIRPKSYSERVFGNSPNIVEFRGFNISMWETFERTIITTYFGAIATQALEKYTTIDSEYIKGLKDNLPNNLDDFYDLLKKGDKLKENIQDITVINIIFAWVKLMVSVVNIVEDHNKNFLENELHGYFDEQKGQYVQAQRRNKAGFKSVIHGIDPEISVEKYAEGTKFNLDELFTPITPDFVNKLSKITNLYLKPSVKGSKTGDRTNSLAFLQATKLPGESDIEAIDYKGDALTSSIFDRKGQRREGYYVIQAASERMLIQASQIALMGFVKDMEGILKKSAIRKKEEEIQPISMAA